MEKHAVQEEATTYGLAEPEEIRGTLRAIVALVERLRADPVVEAGASRVPDRPRTISIVGGRGQGKSTALVFAVDALRGHGDLVLPIIDPERFSSGDTLIGWVLAHLQHEMPSTLLSAETAAGKTISRACDDLLRTESLLASRYAEGLAQRGVTPEEYSRDAAHIPAAGTRFGADWSTLIDAIANASGDPSLRLIIPIDDADLVPSLLPGILADVQVLGTSSRVIVLTAFDEPTLRQAMTLSLLSQNTMARKLSIETALTSTQDIRQLVQQRFVKHFPRSLHVRLDPVPPGSRFAFHPLDKDPTLGDILRTFKVQRDGMDGLVSLEDLFLVRTASGEPFESTDYTRALPDTKRGLRQLYEALEQLAKFSPEASPAAFGALIEHGLEFVAGFSHMVPDELIRLDPPEADGSTGLRGIDLELKGVRFGRVVGFGERVFSWRDQTTPSPLAGSVLWSRDCGVNYMQWSPSSMSEQATGSSHERHNDSDASEELQPAYLRLPDALAHLVFLAWEGIQFRRASALLSVNQLSGRVLLPGGGTWRDQVHGLDRSIPMRYWTVPDWECYSDYFAFALGWNHFRPMCIPPDDLLHRTEAIEMLQLAHLDLVVTIQRTHTIPDHVAGADADALQDVMWGENWSAFRGSYSAEVERKLEAAVEDARSQGSQRSADFLDWVAFDLPFMAVRVATTQLMSSSIMDWWDNLVRDPALRARAADVLAKEIGSHPGDERADAEIEVLAQMDTGRARVLADLRGALDQRREGERASVLAHLKERGVPEEVCSRLLQDGATPDVLAALTLANWAPETLVQIAEMFPTQRQSLDIKEKDAVVAPSSGDEGRL